MLLYRYIIKSSRDCRAFEDSFPPERVLFPSHRRKLIENFLRVHVQRFEHLTFKNLYVALRDIYKQIIPHDHLPPDRRSLNRDCDLESCICLADRFLSQLHGF